MHTNKPKQQYYYGTKKMMEVIKTATNISNQIANWTNSIAMHTTFFTSVLYSLIRHTYHNKQKMIGPIKSQKVPDGSQD